MKPITAFVANPVGSSSVLSASSSSTTTARYCPVHHRHDRGLRISAHPVSPLHRYQESARRPKAAYLRSPVFASASTPTPPSSDDADDALTNKGGNVNKDDIDSREEPQAEQQQKSEDEQHKIPQSAIDWNKSWSDFQASGGKTMAPVGREPMSQQEKSRQQVLNSMRNVSNSLPSRQQLFADWRFWISIILVLSLFTAFVNSTATSPSTPPVI